MGYHFYHFYENDEKLAKALASFFEEGLRKLEYCMWVPRKGITRDRAANMLKRYIPDIEDFMLKDQMFIESFENWTVKEDGTFDIDRLMNKWRTKYDEVMKNGYMMMRVAGDGSALTQEYWDELIEYEAMANKAIYEVNVNAVCTYKAELYKPSELQAILKHHLCPLPQGE